MRISSLFEHFKGASLMRSRLLTDMIVQSAAYMAIIGCTKRGRACTPGLLPMGILGLTAQGAGFFTRNRDVRACRRCGRMLDIEAFPFSSSGSVVNGEFRGDRKGPRGHMCRVCVFATAREGFEIRSAVQKAVDFSSIRGK